MKPGGGYKVMFISGAWPLITDRHCFNIYGSVSEFQALKMLLLCQIVQYVLHNLWFITAE